MKTHKDIVAHYKSRYDEDNRLSKDGLGQLELLRTQILLKRYPPSPPAESSMWVGARRVRLLANGGGMQS